MGGKAAYTLATALTMGFVGIVGGFAYFYMFVPKSAVFPILIFVGLEISAQSFVATPKRHFPALVFACVPALAFLAFFFVDQILGGMGIQLSGALWSEGLQSSMDQVKTAVANDPNAVTALDKVSGALTLRPDMRENLMIVLMLKNGFVLTSLIWASLLAMAIDRRMQAAAVFAAIAAVCTLFGFIHSPRIDNSLYLPFSILGESSRWTLPAELLTRVWTMAAGYIAVALLFWCWSVFLKTQPDQGPIYDTNESAI
jgi:AGZA family xanthine/uracil permease-like MFS transporter